MTEAGEKRVVLAIVEFRALAATLALAALVGVVTTVVALSASSVGLTTLFAVIVLLVLIPVGYIIASPQSRDLNKIVPGQLVVRSWLATFAWAAVRNVPFLMLAVSGLWFPVVGAAAAGCSLGLASRMVQLAQRSQQRQAADGLVPLRTVGTGYGFRRSERFCAQPARLRHFS